MEVSSRIAEMGISLPAPQVKPFATSNALRRADRDYVHLRGVAPWPSEDFTPFSGRLLASDSFDPATLNEDGPLPDHVLAMSQRLQSAFFRSLWMAGSIAGGDVDRIGGLLSARAHMVVSPGFENLGFFASVLKQASNLVFGTADLLNISILGVTALPYHAPLALDVDYLLAPNS